MLLEVDLEEVNYECYFRIDNDNGLHLSPATQMARTLSEYKGKVLVSNLDYDGSNRDPGYVDGKNIMGLLTLDALTGHSLHFIFLKGDSETPRNLVERVRDKVN